MRLATRSAAAGLRTSADTLVKRCDELESRLHNPEAEVVYDVLAGRQGGAKLYSQLAVLFSDMQSSDYEPAQGQLDELRDNLADMQQIEVQLQAMRGQDLAQLEARATALGLPRVILPERN